MSEEIRKPSAELSEAALANVSGGGSDASNADMMAMNWCLVCNHRGLCDKRAMSKLASYIREHGNIDSYTHCPFYEEA